MQAVILGRAGKNTEILSFMKARGEKARSREEKELGGELI